MDNDYINSHLINWIKTLCGKDSKPFSKRKGDYFVFGDKNSELKNKVTKQIAILLILNKLPDDKNKSLHITRDKKTGREKR
jgi:hypothetical protein